MNTNTLLPKPVIPQASSVQQNITVAELPTPASRDELKPLWNKQVLVAGTVTKNVYHGQRAFTLLTDVRVSPLEERLKDYDDRIYTPIDHSWIDITGEDSHAFVGAGIYRPSVVISYQRANGTWSYGFRGIDTAGAPQMLQVCCADLYLKLLHGDHSGSKAGAIQAALNRLVKELRSGVDAETGCPIVYAQYGRSSFIKLIEATFRKLIAYAKCSDFKVGMQWLADVVADDYDAPCYDNPAIKSL